MLLHRKIFDIFLTKRKSLTLIKASNFVYGYDQEKKGKDMTRNI